VSSSAASRNLSSASKSVRSPVHPPRPLCRLDGVEGQLALCPPAAAPAAHELKDAVGLDRSFFFATA
jgi:hypothetical protein